MAKKNVRSRAANSSSDDDLQSQSPQQNSDYQAEFTEPKASRSRRRPPVDDETDEIDWPARRFDPDEVDGSEPPPAPRRRTRQSRAAVKDTDESGRPESQDRYAGDRYEGESASDSFDSGDHDSYERGGRDRYGDSRDNQSDSRESREGRNSRGDSRDSRNDSRDSRNDSRDSRNDSRDSRGGGERGGEYRRGHASHGNQQNRGDDRDNRNDGNRRQRRRRNTNNANNQGGGGYGNNQGGGGYGNNQGGGGYGNNQGGGGYGNRQQQGNPRNTRRTRRPSGPNTGPNAGPNRGRNFNQASIPNRFQQDQADNADFDASTLFESYGVLEVHPNGYGFMRHPDNNYTREKTDPFVPGTMIEKFALRPGVMLRGMVQPARRSQGPRLRELFDVDGLTPEEYPNVKNFDELTPINPVYWYRLETGPAPLTTRVMDLLTPLGKGQRALIVAPPRSGKTVMLQHIANGIAENHPKSKLIVLLVDERPEEVTDMKRNVRGEVIASSLDEDIESHVRLSQMVIARCKRLAEMGQDVFLLMDSITRLARAFNKWVGNTGRTMTGGVDIKAMDIPKKLFSSARAFEEGGSLTIVGTALVDTGSRMDELIFQEFKGTGNMELVLDRKLADRRVWPAIDITQSGTRREELLLHPDTLQAVTMLRRTLTSMNHIEAMEQLTKQLARFKTNQEFIHLISKKTGEI